MCVCMTVCVSAMFERRDIDYICILLWLRSQVSYSVRYPGVLVTSPLPEHLLTFLHCSQFPFVPFQRASRMMR